MSTCHTRGVELRVARQTPRLSKVVAFYRDGLGLVEAGQFEGHDGYDGVILRVPGTEAQLEFTATEHLPPPDPHPENLLVLYLGSQAAVDAVLDRLDVPTVAAENAYWKEHAVTVEDPDGFRVVLSA